MITTQVQNNMIIIGNRLSKICQKLKVDYIFDIDTGTFYFDKKYIYGNNNLNGKEFIKPIYEYIYKEPLII